MSPCRAIERCFADSPFLLCLVILVRFRDVLRISEFAYLYLKNIYTCDISLIEEKKRDLRELVEVNLSE